jgi:WhiB family redox-sensing transcriptional regulator
VIFHVPLWHARAACLGMDPAVFFPEVHRGVQTAWDLPRSVCGSCPVRAECAAAGAAEPAGMWGGRTPTERRRRTRRAA